MYISVGFPKKNWRKKRNESRRRLSVNQNHVQYKKENGHDSAAE